MTRARWASWFAAAALRADRSTRRSRRTAGLLAGLGLLGAAGLGLVSLSRADGLAEHYATSAESVLDNWTGLRWQRRPPPETRPWQAARQYCDELSLDGTDDWRLPTMKELQTLVDDARTNPAIDPEAFPDTPSINFWSSSLWTGSTELVWVVLFQTGYTNYDRATFSYGVRCVR